MPENSYNYYAASYLASKGRIKSQKEIARILDISEPTVSRFIKKAFKDNILQIRYPKLLLEQGKIDELQASLEAKNISESLEKRLKTFSRNRLQNLRVFGNSNNKSELQTLYEGAASFLIQKICLPETRYTGILWGETIGRVIEAIQRQFSGKEISEHRHKYFMPVCGDSVKASQHGSELISRLYETFTGRENDEFNFAVSASIPGHFKENEIKVIRQYIMEVGGFRNVFQLINGKLRLKRDLNLLITSCSGNSANHNTWLSECAKTEGIEPEELEKITIGNIGGYWLPSDKRLATGIKRLASINARWNGIIEEDFEKMAKKRAVVLIAGEQQKAEVILQLIERRLVNHLLISADLADKIIYLLNLRDEE